MPRIVNNRICFANHNVVCDPKVFSSDYMLDIAELLPKDATAGVHRQILKDNNNDGSWTIEMPTIELTPFHDSDYAERNDRLPNRILGKALLHNGNYEKLIFAVHCDRSQSFEPIWTAMQRAGIRVGKLRRVHAECAYFAMYDKVVEALKASK